MAFVAIRGKDGRAQLVQVSETQMRQMQARSRALAQQGTTAAGTSQSTRFRNAPTTGVKVAAEALSMALTMGTGTGLVGPFVSAFLRDMLMRKADFTLGKRKSPLRAMPGLPFGGLRDIRTGKVISPRTLAQITAAARKGVSMGISGAAGSAQRSGISPNAISAVARANVNAQLARVGGSASSMFGGQRDSGGSSRGGSSSSGGGSSAGRAGSDRGSSGRGFR